MRKKLIYSFIIIVLITIGAVIAITYHQASVDVRNFMFRGGFTGTESIVTDLENYYKTHETLDGAETIITNFTTEIRHRASNPSQEQKPYHGGGRVMHLRLADADGFILFDTLGKDIGEKLTRDDLARAIPLEVDDATIGYLLPEGNYAFTRENELSLLNRINHAVIIATVIAGVVALFIAFLLTDKLVKPIKVLTEAAQNLAEGKLSQRVEIHGNDEIAVLGQTFNKMATALQQAEERRRSLTADIAHELRTPLAVQRAHIEAIEDGIYDLTLENLAPIEEQNRLLSRLVEDLRVLALADTGELTLEKSQVDLVTLTQDIVKRFQAQAQEHKVTIRVKSEEPSLVNYVDSQRIEQILHNLLSNALRHSPESTQIEINLLKEKDNILLSIRDHGAGIPSEALPHIFERFYKTDKSRNRLEGGTGLGLSIAKKLAQAHGGDIKATNHQEGGAIFTIKLPIVQGENQA